MLRWAALCFFLWAPLEVHANAADPVETADDDGWGEATDDDTDDDTGFEELPAVSSSTPTPAAPSSKFSLTGFLRSDQALWLNRLGPDENAFAKARQNIDLTARYQSGALLLHAGAHAEVDLAYRVERESYDPATLDAYETQFIPREVYASLSLGKFELTVGRQLSTWGEGEVFSPLDITSARDLREPGLADLADIRIPLLASRLAYFTGSHRIEAMVVHETHWGFRPEPLGPFGTLPSFFQQTASRNPLVAQFGQNQIARIFEDRTFRWNHDPSAWALDHQQYFLRWMYKGRGADLGLYAASALDREGVLDIGGLDFSALPQDVRLPLVHLRYGLLGHSGASTVGSFVFKWEAALMLDRPYNTANTEALAPEFAIGRAHTLSLAGVLAYEGLENTRISLEVERATLLETLDGLNVDPEIPRVAFRVTRSFLRERLETAAAVTWFGWPAEQGWVGRADVNYELDDGFSTYIGAIVYRPSQTLGPLTGLNNHNRLNVGLRWDFQAY